MNDLCTSYVYEHWRADKNECFYVGKGFGYRAYNLEGRNQHHRNIAQKLLRLGLAIEIKIIKSNLSNFSACELERKRIAKWKALGIKLVNQTDGGDGPGSGRIFSKIHREKLSRASTLANARPDVQKRVKAGLAKVRDQRMASLKRTLANPEHRKMRSDIARISWLNRKYVRGVLKQ